MATLTSRTLASGASLNDLIHIVITGDTSQSANGSSYKATLSQLVPLFSGATNTVVTGGTYNNTTGTATFTNNVGASFTVTGFTTGSTEVFITGGTVNSTGGTATFTNTTGGTFTITGMTTPFSGGSGNCINSLYTDNIYACNNEITIHHRVQSTLFSDAQGTLSFAFGKSNTAIGNYSWAIGDSNTAIGLASYAEGASTTASGDTSHAEGMSTIAAGYVSHAEGNTTLAFGDYSHAEGALTIASGQTSHAEGNGTFAGGNSSHAEGTGSMATGNYSHAEGSSTASGVFSHAEGDSTVASGQYSHSQNKGAIASGDDSHAGGVGSIAYGIVSFSHGDTNEAKGDLSVTLGGQRNIVYTGDTGGSGIFAGRYNGISGITSSDPVYNSVIIGGTGNTVNSFNSGIILSEKSILTADHSVIIGGSNITGNTSDTTYVPNLVISKNYNYTPTGTADTAGEPGSVTWDNNYFYYKDNNGWRRISGSTW